MARQLKSRVLKSLRPLPWAHPIALSVFHDFFLGPKASLAPSPSLRVWASWVARLTLLLGLALRG